KPEKQAEVDQHKRELLHGLIREQVVHALGKPDNLIKVQVRPLWEDHYRVNVLVGSDASCATVAASYFVVADREGALTSCSPKIVRKYAPAAEKSQPSLGG